jgi:hypothetical protein
LLDLPVNGSSCPSSPFFQRFTKRKLITRQKHPSTSSLLFVDCFSGARNCWVNYRAFERRKRDRPFVTKSGEQHDSEVKNIDVSNETVRYELRMISFKEMSWLRPMIFIGHFPTMNNLASFFFIFGSTIDYEVHDLCLSSLRSHISKKMSYLVAKFLRAID